MPSLIVFGGLPGTGKTTISRELARRLSASYIRIDTIEQALKAAGHAVGATGYTIANALAVENLKLDRTVIADCVNPVLASRQGWRDTAQRYQARLVEIESICSDIAEHRRRVESRIADIEGLIQPTWQEVIGRSYEPWDRDRLVLDTASKPIGELVDIAEAHIRGCSAAVGLT
jgi:predicted kinase